MADAAAIPGAGGFADALTDRIAVFVREIGIPVRPTTLTAPTLCPGVHVRRGVILVDAARLAHPGDLLHEAGHIAVCDPATRGLTETIGDDPAEEMAAIAWSYAAACHLGLDPSVVFHEAGYKGGSHALIEAFRRDGAPGTPMLEWFGMSLGQKAAAAAGAAPYPHMLRWLR
jgi:hypothetical protein